MTKPTIVIENFDMRSMCSKPSILVMEHKPTMVNNLLKIFSKDRQVPCGIAVNISFENRYKYPSISDIYTYEDYNQEVVQTVYERQKIIRKKNIPDTNKEMFLLINNCLRSSHKKDIEEILFNHKNYGINLILTTDVLEDKQVQLPMFSKEEVDYFFINCIDYCGLEKELFGEDNLNLEALQKLDLGVFSWGMYLVIDNRDKDKDVYNRLYWLKP